MKNQHAGPDDGWHGLVEMALCMKPVQSEERLYELLEKEKSFVFTMVDHIGNQKNFYTMDYDRFYHENIKDSVEFYDYVTMTIGLNTNLIRDILKGNYEWIKEKHLEIEQNSREGMVKIESPISEGKIYRIQVN